MQFINIMKLLETEPELQIYLNKVKKKEFLGYGINLKIKPYFLFLSSILCLRYHLEANNYILLLAWLKGKSPLGTMEKETQEQNVLIQEREVHSVMSFYNGASNPSWNTGTLVLFTLTLKASTGQKPWKRKAKEKACSKTSIFIWSRTTNNTEEPQWKKCPCISRIHVQSHDLCPKPGSSFIF